MKSFSAQKGATLMKTENPRSLRRQDFSIDIDAVARLITANQLPSGEIPWCPTLKTDPWDHVEAAMGLSIGGYLHQARRALKWIADVQLPDGSCYASYLKGSVTDETREANLSSYIAVGVFHYFLITGDTAFLERMWSTVAAAIEFALGLQTPEGEIYWAISPAGRVDPMALLTGSSSIFFSLKCALAMAEKLDRPTAAWQTALKKLGAAIKNKPYLFNMTKARYAMDWFYPVLAGVLTGAAARQRIEKYWKKFVVEERGVRCVSDEPWITIAETSELSLALAAMGNTELARIVFNWIGDWRYEDGSYWCGFTCPDMTIWPEEKITWTNAAALLAADAIYELTPAGRIFSHEFWQAFKFCD